MRRFPLKSIIFTVYCALTAVVFGACIMTYAGIEGFLNDDKVIEIIEKGAGKVHLVDGSDPGITAGNSKITGLDPNKYYMVETYELDIEAKTGTYLNTRFVKSDGTLSSSLLDIGKVSGTAIIGLSNERGYKVNAALPLTGSVTYEDLNAAPGAGPLGTSATINGELTLPAPTYNYYLDLSASADTITYEIARVGSSPLVSPVAGDIIKLEGEGTTNDYVFYNTFTEVDLYVLKVIVEAVILPELTITITPYQATPEAPIVFAPSSQSFTQTQVLGGSSTFSITASGITLGTNGGWYYGDTQVSNTATFNESDVATKTPSIDFTVIGNYVFTFVGELGGAPFSATFTISITGS